MRSRPTKKQLKIIGAIALILLVVTGVMKLLDVISYSHWTQTVQLSDSGRVRYGAESDGGRNIYFNFCDQGFFRLDGGIMNFYELDRNKTFTLCEKSGCKHEDDSCQARYDTKRPVKGLGTEDGVVYAAFWNEDLQQYQFCSISLDGSSREVIADLPINCFPDPDLPAWFEADFTISYTRGKAWIITSDCSSIYVIDLASQSMDTVTTGEINPMGKAIAITARSDQWILFDLQDYDTEDASASMDCYYLYTLADEQYSLIDQLPAIPYDGEGTMTSRLTYLGEWEDGFVCLEELGFGDTNTRRCVCYWNLQNNTREAVITLEDGDVPDYSSYNVYDSRITAKDEIYYCEFEREDGAKTKAHNYAYHMLSAQTRELYTDQWDFPYRLAGESGTTWLYGNGGKGMDSLTRIRRTNYENGDFYYKPELMQ